VKRWLIALAACGGRPPAPVPLAHSTIAETQLIDLAMVGDATYAFERDRVVIRRGSAIVASAPAPAAAKWIRGAAIPSLDGEGRWAVGIDSTDRLWRIRLDGELEDIDARFGADHVHAVASAGRTVALQIGDTLAYSRDGVHLTRAPIGGEFQIAAASDRIAVATKTSLEVWDLAHGTRVVYPIVADTIGFLAADTATSQLVARADTALYVERDGKLHPLGLTAIEGVAIAGSRLWAIANRGQLFTFDGALHATDAHLVAPGHLFGTPDGAAWFAAKRVEHYELDQTRPDPVWTAHVQPVFERVCAHCHLPGGSADVDLSTVAAWTSEHDEIVRRVIVTRTMPPAGTTLSDADRDALGAWLHAR
jgi:hypothetical protein